MDIHSSASMLPSLPAGDCLTALHSQLHLASKSKSHCDWQSVSQSVSLGVEPHLELMTRYLLLFDSYGLVFVGHPLWREDGSVFRICCWPVPAQSFWGQSPLGLATIFYCLKFETSLFVASYNSQGHDGGIRPCLHMGMSCYISNWGAPSLTHCSSLYSLGTDSIENTTSNSSSVVMWCAKWAVA
jgi:hypothetical protein